MIVPFERFLSVSSEEEFRQLSLGVFRHQSEANPVYRNYLHSLKIDPDRVHQAEDIPFLPIGFFRKHDVICGDILPQALFQSSGTTAASRSRHLITDLRVYRNSLSAGFEHFFGKPEKFRFLALLPTPEQAPDSSLVYMMNHLMDLSSSPENGFFLHNFSGLHSRLVQKQKAGITTMVMGLTYALLDFAEAFPGDYTSAIFVETGGMKGRRKEMIREELHARLIDLLGVNTIYSEYGMTELLSQAWSSGEGRFRTPPWMKVMIREINDPLCFARPGDTGGICVIDLANYHSCSFIATQDLGRIYPDGSLEVLGRFDYAEARGCTFMM